jgi:hypothetical protein
MSKINRRPGREELKKKRREKMGAEKELRERSGSASHGTLPNRKSGYETVEAEIEGRLDAVTGHAGYFRAKLPVLLKRLSRIEDPRNPKKIKYKLTVVMIYGILMFVYQTSSRREANREMTNPIFIENLKLIFPDLAQLPHQDTLMRLLSRIDVNEIERIHLEMVRELIRKKKFNRWLINGQYPVAIDGTQKFKRDWLFNEECLDREFKNGQGSGRQYYVYVLEAALSFQNGMTIPLMSEFLEFSAGDFDRDKQDCELRAFKRLAERLKDAFPRLSIMVLLDGLYPNGPLFELCRKNTWGFMIILPDKCLPGVWNEYEGLKGMEEKDEYRQKWGNRRQYFQWVNNIQHHYANGRMQVVHMVICNEEWEQVEETGEAVDRRNRWVWLSSGPLTRRNVHERCNLAGRRRWNIEEGILTEKRHGYHYEHCFSYDWKAMKGYHYLMRLAHMFNVLAQYSSQLVKMVRTIGTRGLLRFVYQTMCGTCLDAGKVAARLSSPYQLRLE